MRFGHVSRRIPITTMGRFGGTSAEAAEGNQRRNRPPKDGPFCRRAAAMFCGAGRGYSKTRGPQAERRRCPPHTDTLSGRLKKERNVRNPAPERLFPIN